jgi:hypothetical protein
MFSTTSNPTYKETTSQLLINPFSKAEVIIDYRNSTASNNKKIRIPHGIYLKTKYRDSIPITLVFENLENLRKFIKSERMDLDLIKDLRSS